MQIKLLTQKFYEMQEFSYEQELVLCKHLDVQIVVQHLKASHYFFIQPLLWLV